MANTNIMIVDDNKYGADMMCLVLEKQGYDTTFAPDGPSALAKISTEPPDLILLDINMPGMDGFEVASRIKGDPETLNIPVILITGLDTVDNHVKAMDIGVDDFLPKTAAHAEILARVRAHLKIKNLNDQMKAHQNNLESQVALRTIQLEQALEQLKASSLDTIFKLTAASEYRDNETGAHIKRMSHYSALIAQKMGLKDKTVETLLYSASMHDIGKIGIPDKILLKPGKLDDLEWEVMKKHTTIGAKILKGSKISFVRMGETIALTHHEKWDGSGYPQGLKGRKIPLVGRIVALADVFDALTSKRPYKDPFSTEKANQIIMEGRGKHFDPVVVDAFFSVLDAVLKIKELHGDDGKSPLLCLDDMLNGMMPDPIYKSVAM